LFSCLWPQRCQFAVMRLPREPLYQIKL
jgi:hypothetical protein